MRKSEEIEAAEAKESERLRGYEDSGRPGHIEAHQFKRRDLQVYAGGYVDALRWVLGFGPYGGE